MAPALCGGRLALAAVLASCLGSFYSNGERQEMNETKAINYVRSPKEAAERLGISISTLRRLEQRGEGPRRIKISDRRIGYPDSALADFIAARSVA